jgi:hypothetical protein
LTFMPVTYTTADVLAVIEKEVKSSSFRRVAEERSVPHSQIFDTLKGRVDISPALARAFGFEMNKTVTVTFRKAS